MFKEERKKEKVKTKIKKNMENIYGIYNVVCEDEKRNEKMKYVSSRFLTSTRREERFKHVCT